MGNDGIRGEWTYEPAGDVDGHLVGTDHFVIEWTGPGPDEFWREIACPPTEEHARLIAGAQDLRAALKAIASRFDRPRNDEPAHYETGILLSMAEMRAAYDAIDKAEGRSR